MPERMPAYIAADPGCDTRLALLPQLAAEHSAYVLATEDAAHLPPCPLDPFPRMRRDPPQFAQGGAQVLVQPTRKLVVS
ncbi:MAG TPA: hypothetical protein VLH09_10220 [Bryobacteraceae bacterium]|nr:hypothetical protein [Bryobacteraceae bacterium]